MSDGVVDLGMLVVVVEKKMFMTDFENGGGRNVYG